ncbi:mercuric transport protein MerTP [Flagellimonas sp.]|uniref:mercuric transport protein MerTP n=1 Tax=Flagellimonas sp. TaxID=2058762 RepID=UPI003AB34AB8
MNNKRTLMGSSIILAMATSLCCIGPLLAIVAGTSGLASNFKFLEPFRPYLIGITGLVLVVAWYQQLRTVAKKEIDCACDTDEKPSFWKGKIWLMTITVFALAMLAFPYYAQSLYPKQEAKGQTNFFASQDVKEINIPVVGMTCSGCEAHIEHEVNGLDGIIMVKADYQKANAQIMYDPAKTTRDAIVNAILKTGYTIKDQ